MTAVNETPEDSQLEEGQIEGRDASDEIESSQGTEATATAAAQSAPSKSATPTNRSANIGHT